MWALALRWKRVKSDRSLRTYDFSVSRLHLYVRVLVVVCASNYAAANELERMHDILSADQISEAWCVEDMKDEAKV